MPCRLFTSLPTISFTIGTKQYTLELEWYVLKGQSGASGSSPQAEVECQLGIQGINPLVRTPCDCDCGYR